MVESRGPTEVERGPTEVERGSSFEGFIETNLMVQSKFNLDF
jgi:hypothetical protein